MLNLVEYIAKRKKEDNLNEFNYELQSENIRTCVNYVFEYFSDYLGNNPEDQKTILYSEKIEKYRQQLEPYEFETQEWLINIFDNHGNHMNRIITNFLKRQDMFFLYNSDSEFRSLSYQCYSELIKKYPYLSDQTEMLFVFIKEQHKLESQKKMIDSDINITDSISEWVDDTWRKHGVNLMAFADRWVSDFWDNPKLWPASHRKKSNDSYRQYEYDYKQSRNLFNLDLLYRKMPKKPFLRGKKQEFETIMMYYYLHHIEGDNAYWSDYLSKVSK